MDLWKPNSLGFIGLGNMGGWMCLNLRKKLPDIHIYVYDVLDQVVENFIAESSNTEHSNGVQGCSNAKEVAEKSEIVITMVPEGKHVEQVFLDQETGVLAAPREKLPRFLIDCSTIDTSTSLALSKRVDSLHDSDSIVTFCDAPCSGGTPGAEKGILTFMVGMSESSPHSSAISSILSLMGTNIFFCGGPSLGLATKLSNNYLSGIIAIATSEAMNLGMRHGVDPKVLQQCFSKSSGGNWVNDTVNPVPGVCPGAVTSRDYVGGFKIQLMKKDFGLAVQSANDVGAKLVLGEVGLRAYTEASGDPRCHDRDSRVIYRWLGGKE